MRLKAVTLLASIFSGRPNAVTQYPLLFKEFVGGLKDKEVQVRTHVAEVIAPVVVKIGADDAATIVGALAERLQDPDEKMRKATVVAICEIAKKSPSHITGAIDRTSCRTNARQEESSSPRDFSSVE
eukprot:c20713_g1_i8.p2 GENE.c20713_g1_i8~~c20713_g1_i8.p2  ORF type:complete len:127 (+),score=33.29 c20713_g1_i8:505-885(+)